ncbi:uncharacterized protein LOC109590753 [Rhizophagus clarus]|uniref:Uncharacterized protein LOC109590753 n=1 Tax=Rhizophagus clarus TaxID=94130 RepID=A0A8H3LUV3_9GLOM|nr:uncharacterized protein LOC109590753 [Rhizophagus clarus]
MPIVNEEDAGKLKIITPVILRNPVVIKKYKDLIDTVEVAAYWEEINVDQFYSENISLKESLPKYATRAMRKEFVNTCEMFLGNVEKAQVHYIYKEFMGNCSADESEIDARVRLAFELNDPKLVTDFRHFNEGQISIYNPFWDKAKKFLENTAQDSVVAVDERWHDPIVHLARAISVKDLKNQIANKCPENMPIPSIQWCKVGEFEFPVAAVECGKQVIVAKNETFAVGDHDFTKYSLIPSVMMICDVPNNIKDSFYKGKVKIGLKDAIFQGSSSLRHMTELYDILINTKLDHPFLMLYTDGGFDHKNTFLRMQLTLIAMFMILNLDYLVAVHTPPGHSWKNPVERIMLILNLGMQCVRLMRQKMSDEMENLINGCNSMEDIREKVKINNQLEKELLASLKPTKKLLSNIFERQSLKDELFEVFEPATKLEMKNFWKSPKLQAFMKHCCRKCQYFFEIKKCGEVECFICKPIRSDPEIFKELKGLPNPIPGPDNHYKPFSEVYSTNTTETHCPSLQNRKS